MTTKSIPKEKFKPLIPVQEFKGKKLTLKKYWKMTIDAQKYPQLPSITEEHREKKEKCFDFFFSEWTEITYTGLWMYLYMYL